MIALIRIGAAKSAINGINRRPGIRKTHHIILKGAANMIYEKVTQMLSYQLGIEEEKISLSSDIFEDLGADSLDVVTLLMSL